MKQDVQTDVYAIRRERLAELVRAAGGKQSDFAREVADRLAARPALADSLKSFTDATYISRALKGKNGKGGKNIGEDPAAALEALFQKPAGWMSRKSQDREPWPFTFSRAIWDDLSPDEKREAERQLMIYVNGLRASRTRRKAS